MPPVAIVGAAVVVGVGVAAVVLRHLGRRLALCGAGRWRRRRRGRSRLDVGARLWRGRRGRWPPDGVACAAGAGAALRGGWRRLRAGAGVTSPRVRAPSAPASSVIGDLRPGSRGV